MPLRYATNIIRDELGLPPVDLHGNPVKQSMISETATTRTSVRSELEQTECAA
jgi:hypothetical protein